MQYTGILHTMRKAPLLAPHRPPRRRRIHGRAWTIALASLVLTAGSSEMGDVTRQAGVVRAHNPITTTVTWTREISAILERRCVSCHRPGGYASFPLTTYDEARPWAVAIKEEVLAGGMPPWGAAPGVGHFRNDRRPTRLEQEIITAWVDGGAPYAPEARTPAFARSNPDAPSPEPIAWEPPDGGVAIPLAPMTITDATERRAGATVSLPAGMTMTAWTFEPGAARSVERVDLEIGSSWLGTWTPGETAIRFPGDAGAPLNRSATFTARIVYRAPAEPTVDRSWLRVWMEQEGRPKTVRGGTIKRSWRTSTRVDLFAIRPARDAGAIEVIARFANGRAEPVGLLSAPSHGPHPTYRLMRPLSLPAGARLETTGPVRLLYATARSRRAR